MAKRGSRVNTKPTAVRAPAQARSRASMEALLEIGRRLIEERGIDDFTMNDVAEAAGSSIGSLYFRFGNRERFVNEVMDRQIESARNDLDRLMARLETAHAQDLLSAVTNWIVLIYRDNQGLLRSQLRRTLQSPLVWRPFQDMARYIVDGIIRSLEHCPQLAHDAEWRLHVRVAMQMVFGTLNNILINRPGPLEIDDPATAEELARATLRYLKLEERRPA